MRSAFGWRSSSTALIQQPAPSARLTIGACNRVILPTTLLERSHVDDEAILHIASEQTLVRFVDLLSTNHFHLGGNIVRGAEVEHLLGLAGAADAGTGDLPPFRQQAEDR